MVAGLSITRYEGRRHEKNAVVLAGYACQNTTAHELQGNKLTHKKEDGREIPVKSVPLRSVALPVVFHLNVSY